MSGSRQAQVPVLTDGTVLLRELRDDDLGAVVEQSRDEFVQRWSLTIPPDYTLRDAQDFLALARAGWASDERWQWAVEVDGGFAGLVDLSHRGEGVREIGFAAHPGLRGRGHLTRATRLVVAHAFAAGCPLVLWHAAAGNVASRRVAWRSGFAIAPGETRVLRRGVLRDSWAGTLAPGDPLEPTTFWLRPPSLTGDPGRTPVSLRAWGEDDAESVPVGWGPTPPSYAAWHAGRLALEAVGELLSWAVTTPTASDAVVGSVQLVANGDWAAGGSATLDGWLSPDQRGRGVARTALEAVLTHALSAPAAGGLGLARVEARVGADDRLALRLLRRAGFRGVGPTGPADSAGLLLEVTADDDRGQQAVEPLEVPVIEATRLLLRPYRDDDAPGPDDGPDETSRRFLPAAAHPDTAAYPAWLARQRRGQDAGESLAWCVADRTSDRALGYLTLFRLAPLPGRFDAEVGYWLVPGARGNGYVAEALAAVLEHAFAPVPDGGLGLTRLHAGTDADNLASQATLERVGFRRWGEDRQAWRRTDGTLSDGAYFELLASDGRVDRRAASTSDQGARSGDGEDGGGGVSGPDAGPPR